MSAANPQPAPEARAFGMSDAVTVDFVRQRHPVELFGRMLHLRAEELLGRKKHVFCRECANPLAQIYPGHPCVKRLGGVPAYENVYPDAPIYSQSTVEYKQNEYQQHRVERIAAATQRNKDNSDAHNKATAKYRRTHHEAELKRGREWHAANRQKLAEAERILAQRTPEEITNAARLTAAAGLRLRGVSKYQMGALLFPEQNVKKCAVTNAKSYLRRKNAELEAEGLRLHNLPTADREAVIETALSHLARQARPPQP